MSVDDHEYSPLPGGSVSQLPGRLLIAVVVMTLILIAIN